MKSRDVKDILERLGAAFLLVGTFVGVYFLYQIPLPEPVRTVAPLPAFEAFVESMSTGDGEVVTGVYAPGEFAFPAIPFGPDGGITEEDDLVMIQPTESYFLVAHASLAGEHFYGLKLGDEIRIVFGDGSTRAYSVSAIEQYQVVGPPESTQQFVADSGAGRRLPFQEFVQEYGTGDKVVLMTCIGKTVDEVWNDSWGRLVITALPGNDR